MTEPSRGVLFVDRLSLLDARSGRSRGARRRRGNVGAARVIVGNLYGGACRGSSLRSSALALALNLRIAMDDVEARIFARDVREKQRVGHAPQRRARDGVDFHRPV